MKKIVFILIATLGFVSCIEDAEDTSVILQDRKDEIASEDPVKVFNSDLNGMYLNLQQYVETDMSHCYFGQKSFDFLSSLMGNDMVLTGRFAMSFFHYLIEYRGAEYVATGNRWSEYYTCIDNANKILASISADETNPVALKFRAQALGFRGYAYLQLTHLYQFAYKVGVDYSKWGVGKFHPDNAERLCVPINTETLTGNQPRATVAEVYDLLLGDLEEAYAIFNELGQVKTSDPTDIDGCVVANYLMRAYMVKQDWDNAIKYAQVIIDNYPVLTTEADITQGFSSLSLPDVVFGCDITADNSTIYMSWFSQMDAYSAGYGGIGVWRVGFKPLVDRISDTDVRLKWFCCERTGLNSRGNIALRDTDLDADAEYQSVKFIGVGRPTIQATSDDKVRGLAGWELGDYIYLRSEEAYLTKAEALAHKNQTSDACTVLNDFMKTRDPNYTFTTGDRSALLEEIVFQTRVEFWGEGIEYLLNRRLNIPLDRTDATWGADNNHFDAGRIYYDADDYHFLYQIPKDEVENNLFIGTAHQNESENLKE